MISSPLTTRQWMLMGFNHGHAHCLREPPTVPELPFASATTALRGRQSASRGSWISAQTVPIHFDIQVRRFICNKGNGLAYPSDTNAGFVILGTASLM